MAATRALFVLLLAAGCGPSAVRAPTYEREEPRAQNTAPRPPPARRRPTGPRSVRLPMLWEVRSEEAVNYVFGTAPFGVALEQAMNDTSLQQLANARILFLEVDADAGSLDNFDSFETLVQLPEGERLSDHVAGAAVHTLTNELLHAVDPVRLRTVAPWVALRFLMQKRAGAAEPMAFALHAYIQEQAISFRALTNLDTQVERLSRLEEARTGDLIERVADSGDETVAPIVDAYMDGDAEGVAVAMQNSSLAPFFRARYDGAARWRGRLEGEMTDGGVFVATDIGYLVGENGLILALETAGFTATLLGR
ncbi:MAG: TraB/GumN family protein [Myxococcota bacterium]